MAYHKDAGGGGVVHPPGAISATDPGAIGAYRVWLDTGVDGSTANPAFKIRNGADSGWVHLGNVSGFAPLASPGFTGTPTAPTAAPGTNTTQIATTAFIQAAINALVNAAPGALDTLDELANALGDDANFASTVTTALAGKAPLASPTFTGTPAAPTATPGTNTTQLATTAYVENAVASSKEFRIPLLFGNGSGVVTVGERMAFELPDCTMTGWTLVADQAGSIVIDLWKNTYANYPPTVADTIFGTKPALSSAIKAQATGLSIACADGDWMLPKVDSAATITWAVLMLHFTRT